MKRAIALGLLTVCTGAAVARTAPACAATSAAHRTALVELYTSQGCSSCPPADRWLSQLAARAPRDRVVPIALHVSYWDYIGWQDPFARGDFDVRQRALAAASHARTVYTPGVFFQGREFAAWSHGSGFEEALRALVAQPARVRIALQAEFTAAAVVVTASASALTTARAQHLMLALVESGLATRVRAGENRGETLSNDRVVRAWSGPLPLAGGSVHWALPAAADRSRYAVVAFVEDDAMGVLQAVDLPLRGC
jgi:hypothetical protein